MKKLFNIFLLFLGFTLSFAQQYPVRLIPVVIPPYSLKLGDYATSTDNKLQLQVLMTDLMEPQHQTGIKFSLQAGLNAVPFAQGNDFVVGMQPFMLYPGSNITLTNVDLRALFELQNLNGINANQYAQPLSDGVYQFCFQAYDFYTKNNLSQKTCATVFLTQYDPPMLNLPQNAEKVQAVSPYAGGAGIVFQWMPRQIAPNTKYIFTLKELWDLGQSPISGFLSSPPLWREETYAPTLFYGMDKTQLIAGKRYAWQVQAKSGNPVLDANPTEDNGVYRNNGLSEIFYFDYVENCAVPTLLMAKNAGRGRVELSWSLAGQPSTNPMYSVQYRKRGSTSQWQTVQSYQPRYVITGLEDQTEYEYRIGSVCGNLQTFNNTNPVTDGDSAGNAYAYSGVQFFTTDSKDKTNQNYQCGVMPTVDITNKSPLQSLLGANEVFTAGDFPVTVISAQGSNGIYSGTGYIVVPYLADTKIKVSFNNIKLNTDKKLIEGAIETTYDPNETAVSYASAGLGETFGDAGVKEVTIDFPIGGITYSATPPPGKITITGSDGGGGTGSTVNYPGGKDYQFTDPKGNIWTVDENGTVSGPKKPAKGGASTPTNTDGVDSSGSATAITAQGIKVEFENKTGTSGSKYAFDKPTKGLTNDYKEIDGKFIPFKAVENQKQEPFIAKVTITDTAVKADSLIFKTSKGVAIDAKKVGDDFELTLKGTFSYAKEEVQAVIKQGNKYKVAGVFYLVHISPKTIKLNLVPTTGITISDEKQKEIKDIYSKVAIDVDIVVKPPFDISQYLEGGKLPTADAFGDLSTYSNAQNNIISDYKSKNNVGLEYCIFVTDKPSSTGQDGYMRLNGQFGFVYNQKASTIAHELGHGALKLEHPFKQFSGVTKGSTTGLLDYANGTDFIYTDWVQINDPAFKLYAFQGQEQGESTNGASSLTAFLSQNDISEFIYSTQCWWGDGYKAVRFYGKLTNGKLTIKEKTFGLVTNSSGQVISNEKLSDLIGRSDLDNETNFLIYKTKKGWELVKNTLFQNLVDKNCPNINDEANKQQIAQIDKEFQKISSSILGLDDATYKQLTDNLKAIKKNSRANQGFELHHWDEKQKKNRYFTLDENNKLQEVEKPLSDEQLNNGEWTDNKIDSKTRYTVDNNGIVQLKAFGFRKNLPLANGKQADLKGISSHILQQTNDYLSKNKVTNFEAKATDEKTDAFADGKKIEIGKNSTYLKIISEGTGLVTTLLKTAEIEKPTYLDQSNATIKAPGLVTGSVEVIATKVTDITTLATGVYDLATDEKTRQDAYNGMVQVKETIGNDPSAFVPVMIDVLSSVATGNSTAEWQEVNDSKTDGGRRSHLGTRGVENVVISAMTINTFVKNLPEMAEKMSEKIKKVKNVAGDLAERLSEFTKKSLSEKLGIISDSWKKYYPDIFTERRFFEKIMGEYRYKKVDGWLHTGDISDNFKGVDFYKGAEIEGIIDASTAVSMKTTTVKDVNAWLISKPIQDNIKFLEEGLDDTKGIISNNKKMIISEAEIHIYMPKENITPELKATWMDKLKISNPNIKFEINALEDFVK